MITRDEMARQLRQVSNCTLYFYDSLPLADHVLSLLTTERGRSVAVLQECMDEVAANIEDNDPNHKFIDNDNEATRRATEGLQKALDWLTHAQALIRTASPDPLATDAMVEQSNG